MLFTVEPSAHFPLRIVCFFSSGFCGSTTGPQVCAVSTLPASPSLSVRGELSLLGMCFLYSKDIQGSTWEPAESILDLQTGTRWG